MPTPMTNHACGHWTAMVVDFRAKLVLFVDSLHSSLPSAVVRVCAIVETVSQVLRSKSFNFSGWRCGSLQRSSPMQPDYFNCGIFPLLLSRCLHHNVKISRRWTSEDLDAQRDVITLELMKGIGPV